MESGSCPILVAAPWSTPDWASPKRTRANSSVSFARKQGQLPNSEKLDLVLIDGAPGIGCPVIASITGAALDSGRHRTDAQRLARLERVTDLTRHFGVKTLICINKWDLNVELSREIEARARQRGVQLAGNIRYDPAVTEAQIDQQALVEFTEQGSAVDIKQVWTEVSARLVASLCRSRWHHHEQGRRPHEQPRIRTGAIAPAGSIARYRPRPSEDVHHEEGRWSVAFFMLWMEA